MNRIIAALLAATTIAGITAPAAAQTRFFARERLAANAKSVTQPTSTPCGTLIQKTYISGTGWKALANNYTLRSPETAREWCNATKDPNQTDLSCIWMSPSYAVIVKNANIKPTTEASIWSSNCF